MTALNQALFEALKPGGTLLVIDHVAEAGSGLRDTDDDHKRAIFDPGIRGRTDQVMFRFRKPR